MSTQLFSNFSGDSQTYIAAKTLIRIHRDTIVYGLGRKEKLPHRYSTTFQYTRYEKLNLPQTTLTEGVTPSNTSISISTVTAVMNQWGAFVDLSDVVEVTIKHPVLEQAITLLGEQAAETIDRECIKVLQANANVFYAGIATSRATLWAERLHHDSRVEISDPILAHRWSSPRSGSVVLGPNGSFYRNGFIGRRHICVGCQLLQHRGSPKW